MKLLILYPVSFTHYLLIHLANAVTQIATSTPIKIIVTVIICWISLPCSSRHLSSSTSFISFYACDLFCLVR